MFIYREEYYDKESERPGEADIIIAKHRNGPVGDVVLTFQKEYPKFMNYARRPVRAHERRCCAARGRRTHGARCDCAFDLCDGSGFLYDDGHEHRVRLPLPPAAHRARRRRGACRR